MPDHADPITDPTLAALGMAVAKLRSARGWNARQLAERAKIARSSVQRIEAGSDPLVGNMLRLAAALDTTLAELLAVAEGIAADRLAA